MEKQIGNALPDVPLAPEWSLGSTMVLSPSAGVDEDLTQRYQEQIKRCERRTSLAAARNIPYREFAVDDFVAEHRELMDAEGVVAFDDHLFTAISSKVVDALRHGEQGALEELSGSPS